MEQHNGQTIEKAIRRSNISIAELARIIDVNRRTLYNWFEEEKLKTEVIQKIGNVLNHDFSKELPERSFLKVSQTYNSDFNELNQWKEKYIHLLEQYNFLLTSTAISDKSTDAA
jgi:predicted transcriptional regulator